MIEIDHHGEWLIASYVTMTLIKSHDPTAERALASAGALLLDPNGGAPIEA
ncbi:MAG: hypothetical protein H7144_07580 [Burkholderiales bacterium]|nr:hypothetical protein [Phycisphaerae bacterium]